MLRRTRRFTVRTSKWYVFVGCSRLGEYYIRPAGSLDRDVIKLACGKFRRDFGRLLGLRTPHKHTPFMRPVRYGFPLPSQSPQK